MPAGRLPAGAVPEVVCACAAKLSVPETTKAVKIVLIMIVNSKEKTLISEEAILRKVATRVYCLSSLRLVGPHPYGQQAAQP